MKHHYSTIPLLLMVVFSLTNCCKLKRCEQSCNQSDLLKPSSHIVLPDKWNSPDGMTLGKDGNIYLAINNVGDQSYPGKIGVIDGDDVVHEYADLPAHPNTGKVSPLGIVFGSDGNLYVADNQSFVTEERNMSRLLRVNIKNGKPYGVDVVATGLTMANGVSAFGDYIVVNDTSIVPDYPLKSGTYRFHIEELKDTVVNVSGLNDPHLIVQLETKNKDHQVGANGVTFDRKGNMYVCDFGDSEIWKASFDEQKKVNSLKLLCKAEELDCVDGLQIDQHGMLWTADFLGNAIARISPESGVVKVISKNKPGTGENGLMDAPSECIRRGDKVYVANIDLTYGPNTSDNYHSISVFELGEN